MEDESFPPKLEYGLNIASYIILEQIGKVNSILSCLLFTLHYSLISKGVFGRVFRAHSLMTSACVAIKFLRRSALYFEQSKVEVACLWKLRNKSIPVVRIIEAFTCNNFPVIVFEMLGESVHRYRLCKANKRMLDVEVYVTSKRLLEVLAYLSRKDVNIIHGDIKPENVLLTPSLNFDVKLIDFGSSCMTLDQQYSYIQSRRYRAPEVYFQQGGYTPAVDMWSFGCLVAELYSGKPLFGANSSDLLFLVSGPAHSTYPLHIHLFYK